MVFRSGPLSQSCILMKENRIKIWEKNNGIDYKHSDAVSRPR